MRGAIPPTPTPYNLTARRFSTHRDKLTYATWVYYLVKIQSNELRPHRKVIPSAMLPSAQGLNTKYDYRLDEFLILHRSIKLGFMYQETPLELTYEVNLAIHPSNVNI